MKEIRFEAFPDWKLTLFLYKDVKNITEIVNLLKKGKISNVSFINPMWIVDEFQLYIAALKSIHNFTYQNMKTRDIHTELIFNLSSHKNISKSLIKFGINTDQTNFFIGFFNQSDEHISNIKKLIDGVEIPIEQFNIFANVDEIRKYYNIDDKELEISSLCDSIVSRIALQDIL